MIKKLIFDLGGVLLKLDRDACIKSYNNLGYLGFDEVLSEFHQSGFFLDYEKGIIDTEEFRSEIKKHCSEWVKDEHIDNAMGDFLIEIPQYKLDFIKELRQEYKIYMLSNTNPIAMKYVMPMFGKEEGAVYKYFDELFLSYRMKMAKPDPKVYRYVLEKLSAEPSEILFIDDAISNLEAAARFGINTLLIDNGSDFVADITKALRQ
jgi:putative hydrolase of the HAD superfamily